MKTYTLHLPADAVPGDPEPLDEAVAVPDEFSWGAFVFSFLWFFAHRLWLAGLAVLVGVVGFGFLLGALRVDPAAALLCEILVSYLVGLEANNLRRWTYARRGRPVVDVVTASSETEAETKAFARWLAQDHGLHPLAPIPAPAHLRRHDGVLGLFPEAERLR